MADRPIPARSEVPEESTWNLRDVFESDEAWQAEYEAFKAVPEQIEAFRGRLGESAETLLEWFRLNDALSVRLEKLYGYASCKGDEDTGNSFYQDMRGKAMSTLVTISSAAAFATPEIMEIPEDTLNLFYTAQPELETYRRSLYQIRRRKAHILSPAEEKLLASAGEMANASENVASVFRNADMVYPDVVDEAGNAHQLTDATFVPMLMSPDRELRRRAFETYYKQLGQYKNTIAATLDGQFKQLCFFSNARHYDSTIQASLDATEVPVPVYMNLIEAVHKNLDKMWKQSPLKYADRCTTLTLFIHSEEDYRCWMVEALQMYSTLIHHGVPTRLCLFHGENHELSRGGKPKGRIRRLQEITAWMDKYLKEE